ncbi:MAG: VWA domain-containing protein [Polyangiaceae bacterium]|nr:VWA domain-containing protein [Polyangiaceae bacterium]
MRRLLFVLGLSASMIGCGATATSNPQAPSQAVATDGNPSVQSVVADGPSNPNAPWVGAAAASDAFLPGAQDTFVAVWVDVPTASAKVTQAPAAVSLVIDTSGSMAGDKIVHARQAAVKLVESLRDGDIVSIHTFSDGVQERVAPVKLDARSRQQIAGIVAELKPEGGTNLFEGVRVAGMTAMGTPATHPIKRVVLISDGNATVGTTSVDMIGMLGEKAGDRSVQITTIGVGLDYNEQALNRLAMKSSGRLYHLTDSKNLPEIVQSEVALLKSTRAANAKVAIVPAPGVELVGVDGMRARPAADGTFEVPLGAMFAGEHKEFVVRARLRAPDSGSHPIASVRLVFNDPSEGNLERVQEAVARFDVVNDATVAQASRNTKAQGVFAMIDASITAERAAVAMNEDRFGEAEKDLAVTEEKLRMAAKASTSSSDKKRLEATAQRVSQARAGGSAAAAAPAPKKAEMRRKAALDANDAAMEFSGH